MEDNKRTPGEVSKDPGKPNVIDDTPRPRVIVGLIGMCVGIVMAVIDGFEFYSTSSEILWAIFVTCGALMGLGVIKSFGRHGK